LLDSQDLDFYEKGEQKKRSFVRVSNMKALPEAAEYHMQQIMANVLTKVTPITLTQGTIDWKYTRRFSFTSASSYNVIHLCTTKLWHLFESKLHWQALKAYLDGVSPFISEEDAGHAEEIQEVSREQDSSNENSTEYNMTPRTIQEQVAHHVGQLNSGELTARDFRNSPLYANIEYLKHFILYITQKADPNHRKKMPPTPNTVKKAIDQWLDEANKEKGQYFFLKWMASRLPWKKKVWHAVED
jgi:hypothetical protein